MNIYLFLNILFRMCLECGGSISVDSHGTLSSPGSPGRYPPNRDCYWTLNATPGKRIQLHFYSSKFETQRNGCFDYLEVIALYILRSTRDCGYLSKKNGNDLLYAYVALYYHLSEQ